MTSSPKTILSGKLAVDALNLMKDKRVSCMPVIKAGKVVGTIRLQDVIGMGIIG